MSRKVLVIGGSYFVGRAIVSGLLEAGHEALLLNRGTRPVAATTNLIADRNDPDAFARAIGSRSFDWIVDCSCYDARQQEVASRALRGRFSGWIHVGSAAIYQDDVARPTTEEAARGPSAQWGDYGTDKLAAEEALANTAEHEGFAAISLRPPYVTGPGPNPQRDPWIWARLLRRRTILIPNDGATPIQFVHGADLASAVLHAMDRARRGFRAYNVAEGRAYSIREYVELLAEACGVTAVVREIPYRRLDATPRTFFPFRDTPLVLDVSRIEAELGWRARHSLRESLRDTFASHSADALTNDPIDTHAEDALLSRLEAVG